MQKRLLLVAVALVGTVAGKAHAGNYSLEGGIDKPVAEFPAQTFSQDTNRQHVDLSDASETRTTLWLWQTTLSDDPAPGRYLRVSFEHNNPSVTANAQGYGSYAYGYFRTGGVIDPYNAHRLVQMEYASTASENEGPKPATMTRREGGYVDEAFVYASPADTITGISGQRLRGQVTANISAQRYQLTVPDAEVGGGSASTTFSLRKAEATNILIATQPLGQ